MMKKIVIQIYEVQDPAEAQALIALGVDHVGSVIVSENDWKISAVQDTIHCVKGAGAKSSLIPLFNQPDSVFRTLEYYQPDTALHRVPLPGLFPSSHHRGGPLDSILPRKDLTPEWILFLSFFNLLLKFFILEASAVILRVHIEKQTSTFYILESE